MRILEKFFNELFFGILNKGCLFFIQGLLAALPAIFGIGSQLMPKEESGGEQVQLVPEFQTELAKQLAGWASSNMGKFTPGEAYGGKLTAGMSPFESTGMDILNKYLSSNDLGSLFGMAEGQISDTLSGKYADPSTSPFIKSMSKLAGMNLQDEIDKTRASRGARGTFFTTQALDDERLLKERTQNTLNSIIGQFIQDERGKMLEAVPTAAKLAQYRTQGVPLAKIEAATSFGSLPRLIEQAGLESEYQDFLRKRKELTYPLEVAQGVIGTNRPFGQSVTSPIVESNSMASNLMGILGNLNYSGAGQGNFWNLFNN